MLYLAPERIQREPATPKGDVYAAGCLLYHLVTGLPPFRGDDGTVAVQHMWIDPLRPSCFVRDCSSSLETLVVAALAKDPAVRPDAATIARELEALCKSCSTPPLGLGRRQSTA